MPTVDETELEDVEFAPLYPQEDESDLVSSPKPLRYNAAISATDWTVETVISQLRKGNIFLDPEYQRRDAWTIDRKSKYIESLIIGIPTPQIILAEREDKRGSYIVIDGKQRLLSLRQFSARQGDKDYMPFALKGLDVRKDLNLRTFSDFEGDLLGGSSADFENATVRTVVIRAWPDEDYLYEVFLRINSGSVQLSPQELRQALHPGPFTKALNDFVLGSDILRSALNIKRPDFRMRDNELVIRYLAFKFYIQDYRGNLKEILDITTNRLNKTWDRSSSYVDKSLKDLERSISAAQEIFGRRQAFRKWNGSAFETRINRAVFDVVAHYFSDKKVVENCLEKKEDVVEAFKQLSVDSYEFDMAVSGTTKSLGAVRDRYTLWASALSNAIKMPLDVPPVN